MNVFPAAGIFDNINLPERVWLFSTYIGRSTNIMILGVSCFHPFSSDNNLVRSYSFLPG